jgi:hypothetical protein
MDGFIPSLGDLLAISHDMPMWGQSGELLALDVPTKTAITSEPLDWAAAGTFYLAMRNRDGSVAGPFRAVIGTDAYHVVLADWNSSTDPTPDTAGDTRERTHYAFGPGAAMYITARALTIKPTNDREVELSTVIESDYVHLADTGAVPSPTAWQLPSTITSPVVAGLIIRSLPSDPTRMMLSWTPAPTADHYVIEQSGDGVTWSRIGDTSANNYTGYASYGNATLVRVAAVGLTRGAWVETSYSTGSDYMWNATSTTLMWNATSTTLMWRY